jgi:lactose/cellobiose-specific phosphotransferase system IIC component
MAGNTGSAWSYLLRSVYDGTMGILAILIVACGSYSYTADTIVSDKYASPIIAADTSLGCFFILTGLRGESLASFGVYGIFPAVFTMMVSSVLFRRLSSIKALRLEFFAQSGNPQLSNAFVLLIPMVLTLAFFGALGVLFKFVLGVPDVREGLSMWLASLLSAIPSTLMKGLVYVVLLNFLWFLGFNGTIALQSAAEASFGGAASPVLTQTFFNTFVFMGGCGTALCLVLAIIISRRSRAQSRLARLSFFPVLFNLSEAVVFGLPVLLNPFFIIPFLCVPLVVTLISYGLMALGVVPCAVHPVHPVVPVVISGYAATGSVGGCILQMINIAVGTLIYLPFVRNTQLNMARWRKHDIDRLLDAYRQSEQRGEPTSFLKRHDSLGNLTRTLVHDLERALDTGEIELHYQPIVDRDGRVDSVEVLLRWNHKEYGYLYPPLVIALAEEAGLAGRLGNWIFDEACRNANVLCKVGFPNIPFCVNVSEAQLKEPGFMQGLNAALEKYALPFSAVELEITERIALTGSRAISQRMADIISFGFHLVMDDFGAGHSSLMYLKEYNFSKVKLDGSLVREINTNPNCREIVRSIIALGRELGYSVIAEFVETAEQRDTLCSLGCERFQGHLFSPAVPFSGLYNYLVQTDMRIVPTLCLSALAMSDDDT